MIIIVAAIAGIVRLSIQQRRQQKMHLLDDFRNSLERLSSQPLPAQGRASSIPTRKTVGGRSPFKSRKPESPRGEWDRIAPPSGPLFGTPSSLADDEADDFFGHSADWDEPAAPRRDDYVDHRPRRVKPRRARRPLLAGRLWAKPREPWLWTYEKNKPRSHRARRAADVEYIDLTAEEDLVHAAEGNLARAGSGRRSPRPERDLAGPHGSASRSGLEPNRREAATRRVEARRHTASRLN